MKRTITLKSTITLFLIASICLLSSCQLIGDVFKAGVWVGVLLVVGFLALVIYLVTRGSNKN
jgi:hypothetical protein